MPTPKGAMKRLANMVLVEHAGCYPTFLCSGKVSSASTSRITEETQFKPNCKTVFTSQTGSLNSSQPIDKVVGGKTHKTIPTKYNFAIPAKTKQKNLLHVPRTLPRIYPKG